MEDYREEFEEYALTQERFLGCRFTRGADGKYLNDDLQKAWVNFHEERFQRDNAWQIKGPIISGLLFLREESHEEKLDSLKNPHVFNLRLCDLDDTLH